VDSFTSLLYGYQQDYTLASGLSIFAHRLGRLPDDMKPPNSFKTWAAVSAYSANGSRREALEIIVDSTGYCYLSIANQAWTIISVIIPFGYEAAPL
jgi:hypothetical protein